MKTVRPRPGGASFVLCDPCWAPVCEKVWVVPGRVACFGTCTGCSDWFALRGLRDPRPGGRRGAPSGTCPACAGA